MELFDLITKEGNKTGATKRRSLVHADGDWHKTAHLWIVNGAGQILMQKRTADKDCFPNMWAMAVGGHLLAGQSSIEAMARELTEELGIEAAPEQFQFLFSYLSSSVTNGGTFIDNEILDVYLLRLDSLDISTLKLQEEEVAEVKWITLDELERISRGELPEYIDYGEEYRRVFEFLK